MKLPCRFCQHWLLAFLAMAVLGLLPAVGFGQERVVWIYKDVPDKGIPDKRSPSERLFLPYYYYPADVANDIKVVYDLPANTFDKKRKGTVVSMAFRIGGVDWWGAVGFTPQGKIPGTVDGLNVNQLLKLGGDMQIRVVLKFEARCDRGEAKVSFKVGGQKDDGLEFPVAVQPSPTKLSDTWAEYTIDLTGDPAALKSVICPLSATVKASENPGLNVIRVYVDNIRFEVLSPEKK